MKRNPTILFLLILMTAASLFSKPLAVGDPAPKLIVTTHTGESLDLGEVYAKGPVVVYFYPKSDTPGCTKQACNLRDNYSDLQAAGVQVVGVSTDSVKDQEAFREKYNLPFLLVADPDKELGKAFGTGSLLGMAYKRQTFLIVDGKIAWRDLKAKPATQSADALAALKALGD
ncbi:MAG: peroxiredoxin [Oceanipulchritudo sp.]